MTTAIWPAVTNGGGGSTIITPSGPAFDAFGRLRVSNPQTVFDSKLVNDNQPLYWAQTLIGGATATWIQPDACERLVTPVAGASAVRQTKRYFNYQPGKSQLVFETFNLYGLETHCIKRAGYFDASNGLLLELDGVAGLVKLVRRSTSSTGSLSVPQAAWNLDPLNGTGPSGITLDFTKTQILAIDFEWLGVGSVRMGFVLNGAIVYAHRFDNANLNVAVFMRTPNLPIRYEIVADATLPVGQTRRMDCICSTVISEGGADRTGIGFAYPMPAPTGNIGAGATVPLIQLSLNPAYLEVTAIPTVVNPLAISTGVSTWEFALNATNAGTAAGGTNVGYCDTRIYAPGATSTGGTIVASGVFSNQSGLTDLNLGEITTTLPLVDGDKFTLRVTNHTGGNERYIASLGWIALT